MTVVSFSSFPAESSSSSVHFSGSWDNEFMSSKGYDVQCCIYVHSIVTLISQSIRHKNVR